MGDRILRISRLATVLVAAGVAATLAPTASASAAWPAGGSGHAGAAAATMPTGAAPTASAISTTVTVSWPVADLSSGAAVAGYVINRFNAVNGAPATVGAGCSGIITTTSCTETAVPAGTWVYTETPVVSNWTGGQSPASAAVTVP
jgi:hypothetical protein